MGVMQALNWDAHSATEQMAETDTHTEKKKSRQSFQESQVTQALKLEYAS